MMKLSWKPTDILVVCVNEADLGPLEAAGYRAVMAPGAEDFGPIPKAEHYVVLANGASKRIAQDLIAAGVTNDDWRISVNELTEWQDLTHVEAHGGTEAVQAVMRKSRALVHEEILPFIEVQKPDHVPSYKTGWPFFDPHLRWSDKEVVIGCGQYAGGKSQLFQMLACDFADVAGRQMGGARSAICGLEDADWRIKRNIERFATSREARTPSRGGVSGRIRFMLDNVHRIGRPASAGVRDIAWFLDRARTLHLRDDCRFFALDPWNQHDEQMAKAELETQYVNRMLRDICQFAEEHKVIVCIVTHIAAKSYDEFGNVKPFRIAQAAGSSHFGRMADRGICVARSKSLPGARGEDRMVVKFDKAKDEESMGLRGALALNFDPQAMDIRVAEPEAVQAVREFWGN